MLDILSKIFGFIGVASTIFIYQQKSRKGLLVSKLISDVFWLAHYALLGAYSGAASAIIALTRELVFINRDKKWAKSRWWLVLFLVLSALSAVVTWKNAFSLLPAAASALSVISFWIGSPCLARIFSFPISASMLSYDIVCSSTAGIINEVLALSSSVVGILRHDIKHKKED